MRRASGELTREVIFADLKPAYHKFSQKHGPEIEAAIVAITEAHQELDAHEFPRTKQSAYVRLYFHVALNNLMLATHFLVAGYFQAAGQQLRSYAEASAMALLLLLPDQWERFDADRQRFPVDNAMELVQNGKRMKRLQKLLDIDPKQWSAFVRVAKIYNHHSHASVLSLAAHIKLGGTVFILGGEYDPEKREQYRDDLTRIASGADVLRTEIEAVRSALEKVQGETQH